MGSGDINIAGLRMTPAEWNSLDSGLRQELLRVVVETNAGWDDDAYDTYELGLAAAEAKPAPRLFGRMETQRVKFIALGQPLGV